MKDNTLNIEQIEASINKQIAFHEQNIKSLKLSLKLFKENYSNMHPAEVFMTNAPLSKELVIRFIKAIKKPVRTIDIIDIMYPKIDSEKRTKKIRVLSVMLNQLEKRGEVTIENKKGVKGNYYTIKK